MNGQPNTVAHGLKREKRSMVERGLADHSFFELHFHDGSSIREHECNWGDHSEETVVGYFNGKKRVMLSTLPIKNIHVSHDGREVNIEVPEGARVYQAVRAEVSFSNTGARRDTILGRCVGLVVNGEVVEEQFIDALANATRGVRR